VTEEMTAKLANFLHVRADMLEANEIWADTAWFGLADAKLVRSDMFEGKEFFGGVFTATNGGRFQTSVEEYSGVTLDNNGLRSYNANGLMNFDLAEDGAQFTGTVTSGFDPDLQAVLSDNVFSNRPGVQFNIGLFNSIQPFVTGWATHNDFPWGEGMLHLSSGRTAFDAPAEVFLSRNGTWQIGNGTQRIYSAGNFVEVVRDDSYLRMHGEYTSLWYGQESNGGRAYLTQRFGMTEIRSAAVELVGAVTVQGSLGVTGSKNFIMDHPTKPGMLLVHGSTESPVSGVEYWGYGTVGANGEDVIVLPEYFEALAKPDNRTAFVTGRGEALDWSDIVDGTVTVYGNPGTKYSWLVKAERFGGDFEVEREAVEPSDTEH